MSSISCSTPKDIEQDLLRLAIQKKTSSTANQRRIKSIQKLLGELEEHDIQNLIDTDDSLQNAIAKRFHRKIHKGRETENIDYVISSLGNDEATWMKLSAKHEGLRNFLSIYHSRKLDEKAGVVLKQKKQPNAYQRQKKQLKKQLRKENKDKKEEQKEGGWGEELDQALDTVAGADDGKRDIHRDHQEWEENQEPQVTKWEKAREAARRKQQGEQDFEEGFGEPDDDKVMDWLGPQ